MTSPSRMNNRQFIAWVVAGLVSGGAVGGGTSIALTGYRVGEIEKSNERRDERIDKMADDLANIRVGVARIETKLESTPGRMR